MIELRKEDITHFEGDIIVNAANSRLAGGGGVDGAIQKAAGPDILRECKRIVEERGEVEEGQVVITKAGNLKSRFIIHAVGPQWRGGENMEDQKLAACYINALKLCEISGFQSIAFPNISTGVYGYPKEDAAEVAIETVRNYLSSATSELQVYFYCYDEMNHRLYEEIFNGKANPPLNDPII